MQRCQIAIIATSDTDSICDSFKFKSTIYQRRWFDFWMILALDAALPDRSNGNQHRRFNPWLIAAELIGLIWLLMRSLSGVDTWRGGVMRGCQIDGMGSEEIVDEWGRRCDDGSFIPLFDVVTFKALVTSFLPPDVARFPQLKRTLGTCKWWRNWFKWAAALSDELNQAG